MKRVFLYQLCYSNRSNDIKINFIDTPGYFDFEEIYQSLRASEAALVSL